MTIEEKQNQMATMLGVDNADNLLSVYLLQAKAKILNKLYPFKEKGVVDVPERYEQLQIELAISLYNLRGAEGESSHNENGVNRSWRSETEILAEITPFVGLPL